MVYFTDMLTEAILGAPDDQALHGILQAGVTEIEARRKNKVASRRSCYLNLIMSLKYQSGNNPNHRQRINISKAVAILEDLRSHEYENIF